MRTTTPTKRSASQAGLDISAAQPKRACRNPFIDDEEDELELPPPVVAPTRKVSVPSTPTVSPLSPFDSSRIISSDTFAEYQAQRQDELQVAEEAVFNSVTRLKHLNNDNLTLTIHNFLEREIRQSVYNRAIPFTSPSETKTRPVQTDASVASLRNSTVQTESLTGILISSTVQTDASVATLTSHATQTEDTTLALTSSASQTEPLPICESRSTQTTPIATPLPPLEPTWEDFYKKDLEAIKMTQPFVPENKVPVLTVKNKLREARIMTRNDSVASSVAGSSRHGSSQSINKGTIHMSSFSAPAPVPARKPSTAAAPTSVISIDDSDDDDDVPSAERNNLDASTRSSFHVGGTFGQGGYTYDDDTEGEDGYGAFDNGYSMGDYSSQGTYQVEPADFYGLGKGPHRSIDDQLRYQDRQSQIGSYPTPAAGHRLQMDAYSRAVGSTHRRRPGQQITKILEETSWGCPRVHDEARSVQLSWARDNFKLMKGFPLIEDVEFIVPDNKACPDGDCYWRSIAFHLYGSGKHWDLVKAEHLSYAYHVLSTPGHARHDLYSNELNQKFFKTASTADGGQIFRANMYQGLHLAHAWTPALMQQVTADLYNICVITFTRGDNMTITETAVRGSYNSRHIFLQFVDDNHFQPMCPNRFAPSEFRYPRVTAEATARFTYAPKANSSKTGVFHPWRNDFTREVPGPVPRLHGCDVESLRSFLGSHPTS
ncbi:hypothetical protein JX266_001980 [Neoarthrinium moseri]|nr:hypothetical protein JX266_001980 [Neoarthrinium moseri]